MFTERLEYYGRAGYNDPESFQNYLWPHDKEGNVVVTDMRRVWMFCRMPSWYEGARPRFSGCHLENVCCRNGRRREVWFCWKVNIFVWEEKKKCAV